MVNFAVIELFTILFVARNDMIKRNRWQDGVNIFAGGKPSARVGREYPIKIKKIVFIILTFIPSPQFNKYFIASPVPS